jgi:hypothetical protein
VEVAIIQLLEGKPALEVTIKIKRIQVIHMEVVEVDKKFLSTKRKRVKMDCYLILILSHF